MTTEKIAGLLKKKENINNKLNKAYKELEKLQIMISHYNKEINNIEVEMFQDEEGYL
jgi:predicted  nucleic acid-binding Zn-ribbon protein